jgi:hypothetical protein
MSEFNRLAKEAFESYQSVPYETQEWLLEDTFGHLMEFLARHDSIHEMPGLRQALQAMSPEEWDLWRMHYPEYVKSIIEPIHKEVTQQVP